MIAWRAIGRELSAKTRRRPSQGNGRNPRNADPGYPGLIETQREARLI